MILTIKEKNLSQGFVYALIKNLKNQLYINLDNKDKLSQWNDYLNLEIVQKKIFISPKQIKITSILIDIFNHIVFIHQDKLFVIKIDDVNKFPNSQLTYDQFARLINFGNLEIQGFDLFTKSFNYIKNNYSNYKNRYMFLHQ